MKINSIEHLEHEKSQAKKVMNSHGADSDYTMRQMLVVKAVAAGIEDPYEWANQMIEMLNTEKIKAI